MAWDTIAVNQIPQPITQIFMDKQVCPQSIFAFWLRRISGEQNVGEMTLCGIDKSHYVVSFKCLLYYSGTILNTSWIEIIKQTYLTIDYS